MQLASAPPLDTSITGTAGDMKTEVAVASTFISSLLRITSALSEDELRLYSQALSDALLEHYYHHWFPHAPFRGSGYRCLRINHNMDPLIGKAGAAIGLTQQQVFSLLPKELTLWVDPYEVSYRIGEDGSTCILHKSSPLLPQSATSADTSTSCREKLKTRRCHRLGLNILRVLR